MLSRLFAQIFTRGTYYKPGNISTEKEAKAALAMQDLEARCSQVADDMLKLDGSPEDLNPKLPLDVYLAKPNASGFTGQAIRSGANSTVSRLEANSPKEMLTVGMDGYMQTREMHHVRMADGAPGEKVQVTETWGDSDGTTAWIKTIQYKAYPPS